MHETKDLNVRGVVIFAAVLLVVGILIHPHSLQGSGDLDQQNQQHRHDINPPAEERVGRATPAARSDPSRG